jgi:hypothetical protein
MPFRTIEGMLPEYRRGSENLTPGTLVAKRRLRLDVGDHLDDELAPEDLRRLPPPADDVPPPARLPPPAAVGCVASLDAIATPLSS